MSLPWHQTVAKPRREWLRWGLGWAATFLVLAIVIVEVPLGEAIRDFAEADLLAVGLAAVMALVGQFVLAPVKYGLMLRLLGMPLRCGTILAMRAGTLAASRFLPLMASDAMRIAYLKRVHGFPLVRGGLLSLMETGWDVLALLTLAAVATGWGWAWAACVAGGGAVAAIVLRRSPSRPPSGRLEVAFARLVQWFRKPRTRRDLAKITLLSFLIVACDIAVCMLSFRAIHLDCPLDELAPRVTLLILVSAILFTPMGLGTREAAALLLLAPYGTAGQRVAGAFATSMLGKVLPALAGLPWVRPVMAHLVEGASARVSEGFELERAVRGGTPPDDGEGTGP